MLSRDILLEDENEPPMGGGRRERRPNRCLCGKLNPELISQCLRGPASQIGYQRERDVTGELIWKEWFKQYFFFRHGGQHWGEWYRRFRRANEEVESIMRLKTKKFHALFKISLLVSWWDSEIHIRPIMRTKWDTFNFLSVVSPYTNRRLCDNCTNHTSIWTSKTQNRGQLEES